MNPVANQNKIETYIKCKKCSAEVSSITHGDLVHCKCGAISVDGPKDLVRVLGNLDDYEKIQR